MIKSEEIRIISKEYNQFVNISQRICEIVENSGIREGMVFVVSMHTTTGILVNEGLECLEEDMANLLGKLAPEDGDYFHARFLHSYGAMAGNPTGHLKSLISGYHCMFPVKDGKVYKRQAQDIYFAEFDGPQERNIMVTIMGET